MTDGPAENDRPPAAGEKAGIDPDPNADAEPVAIEEILVPVDGSEESIAAVEYAVAIAARYDARVHALYILDEELVRRLTAGTIEAEDVAARGEGFMDAARECAPRNVSLTHSTAYGFSPNRKTRHPGSVITEAAAAAAVDFVVIPREPGGPEQEQTLSKAAEYVLQYADQPVLST